MEKVTLVWWTGWVRYTTVCITKLSNRYAQSGSPRFVRRVRMDASVVKETAQKV